jgi:hypothetical protein
MISNAEQVEYVLLRPYIKLNNTVGQLCLSDAVVDKEKSE